jgi:hypothetical protein
MWGAQMTTRVVDEREHRRGLVLGLTLAEVLLLLLFLVMLALSIPLMTHDKDGKPQEHASTLRHEVAAGRSAHRWKASQRGAAEAQNLGRP